MKKWICMALTAAMLLGTAPVAFGATAYQYKATPITITAGSIRSYNNQPVSTQASDSLYVKEVATENSGLGSQGDRTVNRVLYIKKAGTYQLEGSAAKTQICIDTTGEVKLILDDLTLNCESAPVLLVQKASKVTLQLEPDSKNSLNGGYYRTYTDAKGKEVSLGGAISSNAPLVLTGGGSLTVNGKNDGFEVNGSITLSCGQLTVSVPGTAVETLGTNTGVTITSGKYRLSSTKQGSGIRTQGEIKIQGGRVEAASQGEGESGLAAKQGVSCSRGATVYSTGLAHETWKDMATQTYLYLAYSETRTDGRIEVKNDEDRTVATFQSDVPANYVVLTNIDLNNAKTYTVYSNGQQLQFGGRYSLSGQPAGTGEEVNDVVDEAVSTAFCTLDHGYYFGNVMNAGRNAIGDYVVLTPEERLGYTDVQESDAYFDAVAYCKENGILLGVTDTEFGVNVPVTRGMAVTALYRLAGLPDPGDATALSTFSDVDPAAYYSQAAQWAANNRIIYGTTEGTFLPDSSMTREQMAMVLYRFATYRGTVVNTGDQNVKNMADYRSWNGAQKQAISYCINYGLMSANADNTFHLNDPVTRVELAQILYQRSQL